jgi:hypothetical protein
LRKGFGVEWEAMGDAVEKGTGDLPGLFVEWLRVMGETVGERIGSSVEYEIGLMEDAKLMGGIGEGEVGWA